MLGAPIQFTAKQFTLHQRMCTLIHQHFEHWIIDPTASETSKIPGPGRSIKDVLNMLNNNLQEILKFSAKETEEAAELSLLTSRLQRVLSHSETASSSEKTLDETKREFYIDLHAKLFFCSTLNNYIFRELHRRADEGQAIHHEVFHQTTGYLLLLSCVLGFNMMAYQTHPVYQVDNAKRLTAIDEERYKALSDIKKFDHLLGERYQLSQHLHCERIILLQSAMNNWITLLESFHLKNGQDPAFEELRQLFIQRYVDFQEQLKAHPAFIDVLPIQMRSEFSLKELTYHTIQMQARAKNLGFAFNPQIVQVPADNLYIASPSAVKALIIKMLEACENKQQLGQRAQILFYYNEPNGQVDVFDVRYNPLADRLEIINIHSGHSPAQHDLLRKLSDFFRESKLDFTLYACQADLGTLQQSPALYALRLSVLLAKTDFASLTAYQTSMPTFEDSTIEKALTLKPLVDVNWFDLRALGPKAILLNSSFSKIRRLLPNSFAKYEAQYSLSEATSEDPDMGYTYAEDYRKRLAYDFALHNPFKGLSLDGIKKKLNTENNGQAVRRACAGFSTMREFRFLLDYFKRQPDQSPLHLPAAVKELTPLHWALKNNKASRAALLLTTAAWTPEELAEKNKEQQSAYDYFSKAAEDSAMKQNTVLARFLKR